MLTSGSHTAEVNEEGTWRPLLGQEGGRVSLRGPLSGKQTPPIQDSCLAETPGSLL